MVSVAFCSVFWIWREFSIDHQSKNISMLNVNRINLSKKIYIDKSQHRSSLLLPANFGQQMALSIGAARRRRRRRWWSRARHCSLRRTRRAVWILRLTRVFLRSNIAYLWILINYYYYYRVKFVNFICRNIIY